MGVKVITLDGEGTVKLPDGQEKKVAYKYNKIVTPATKRNAGTEAEQKDATFPTFAELAQFLGGNVEFQTKKNEAGVLELVVDAPTPAVQYIIDGWNLEANRLAKEKAGTTPAIERAKARMTINEMKVKLAKINMPTAELDAMLKQLDDADAAEKAAEAEAAKAATTK